MWPFTARYRQMLAAIQANYEAHLTQKEAHEAQLAKRIETLETELNGRRATISRLAHDRNVYEIEARAKADRSWRTEVDRRVTENDALRTQIGVLAADNAMLFTANNVLRCKLERLQ